MGEPCKLREESISRRESSGVPNAAVRKMRTEMCLLDLAKQRSLIVFGKSAFGGATGFCQPNWTNLRGEREEQKWVQGA